MPAPSTRWAGRVPVTAMTIPSISKASFVGYLYILYRYLKSKQLTPLLRCSGDLATSLSNGPFGASYGLLRGLIGDTKWTY